MPLLENMNLRVLSELPFFINLTDEKKAWIHDFELETHEGDPVDLKHIHDHFLEGFYNI